MNYAELLLKAINEYNEDDLKSKTTLRDLICLISDNEELRNNHIIKNLLYIASQKMRVFGYNIQNGFNEDPDKSASTLTILQNESIKQNYRSQVWSNNILDKTQKDIIDYFQSLSIKRMLVSAPTSYGKTFIMREILYLNREKYNNILLVFPTVALLHENAENMEKLNSEKQLGYRVIKSVDNEIGEKNIFVFTPERAMQLLANYPSLHLDFFFYDEMYKIDEDFCYDDTDEKDEAINSSLNNSTANFLNETRAKTFRICLYLLSKQVPEYYLAGPNLSEKQFGKGMITYLLKNKIQIKTVTFEPTKRIRIDAYSKQIKEHHEGLPYPLKENSKEITLGKKNERICNVIKYIEMQKYGSTLLYCTTPSKANMYAAALSEGGYGKPICDSDYSMFLDHIKHTYDVNGSITEWSFWNVMQNGFALHHGKLPKYIQKEVLDLFNRGIIDILFCTSTIVEGVNTNAKNMVVLNHTKGRAALTAFDLKNIIGRAGRYYHNFIGRYFLLDSALAKITDANDLSLNFVTYDNNELDAIDLDNAEIGDLSLNNAEAKQRRFEVQRDFNLPEDVFVMNRLVKKEYQENLLTYLLNHSNDFNSFLRRLKYPDILLQFTEFAALNSVLKIFQGAGLLDDSTVRLYSAISISYTKDGFKGILKYQINKAQKGAIKYDIAYSKAFKTQKDIIEHKIPKILTLFESIFTCAARIRGTALNNFSLSKVIRFYETGVRSYFGEQLVEFGFPIDAIRKIENSYPQLISLGSADIKNYVKRNQQNIFALLDEYEKRLLLKAIKSFN